MLLNPFVVFGVSSRDDIPKVHHEILLLGLCSHRGTTTMEMASPLRKGMMLRIDTGPKLDPSQQKMRVQQDDVTQSDDGAQDRKASGRAMES